jgi:two-component system, LytTR family, response regulator
MKSIRTVIVEDEAPARDILKHYLKEYPEIEIVAECADGFSGLKTISEKKPDLVFLDIQMPRLIFTTAYDQFAIKAFELNALDYLLKPYPKERLRLAVMKAVDKLSKNREIEKPNAPVIEKMPAGEASLSRIVVRKGNSINLVPVEQLRYVEAQDDYVMIYYEGGKALKQQTMKYYEENLPQKDFARIHRSCIVRVSEIKRIEPYGKDTHVAILGSGERLPVSRAGYKQLKGDLSF